jgi:hypothetical protein
MMFLLLTRLMPPGTDGPATLLLSGESVRGQSLMHAAHFGGDGRRRRRGWQRAKGPVVTSAAEREPHAQALVLLFNTLCFFSFFPCL